VTLRSAIRSIRRDVNFRYFDEGSEGAAEDLESVVEGIRLVRSLTARLKKGGLVAQEVMPGEDVQSEAELQDFVKKNAWGHHASCTCAIGPREGGGVLASDFRVHGTRGLRVVDASGLSAHPRLLSRGSDLHDRREGGGRDPGGRVKARAARKGREAGDEPMAYTIPQLLKMSQAELTTSSSRAGRRDPEREAKGTAIVAPGTTYSEEIAASSSTSRGRARPSTREGRAAQPDPAARPERDHREGLQGAELARPEGVHRARLLRDVAPRALDPRRDPLDRPGHVPGKVYWDKKRLIDFALEFQQP
jgi:hypothetical protein